ncbi:MAG: hypothetical protein AVDCRST_MAG64-4005, partial [uncultured Phycisphaerae bacterium]
VHSRGLLLDEAGGDGRRPAAARGRLEGVPRQDPVRPAPVGRAAGHDAAGGGRQLVRRRAVRRPRRLGRARRVPGPRAAQGVHRPQQGAVGAGADLRLHAL